jgi:transcription initiation factor TFIID subunit 4
MRIRIRNTALQCTSYVSFLLKGLIDGRVEPEHFTTRLQKELNSSPQPCLVPFLKKSLPYLQHSLATGELTIEGVRAPSLSQVGKLPPAAVLAPPPTPAPTTVRMAAAPVVAATAPTPPPPRPMGIIRQPPPPTAATVTQVRPPLTRPGMRTAHFLRHNSPLFKIRIILKVTGVQ